MPQLLYHQVQLPPKQPDRCDLCPLCGKKPADETVKGQRQGYCCLGEFPHPSLTSKGIHSSAENYKKMGRRLHRPCDRLWAVWMTIPRHVFGITMDAYFARRRPFELEQERKAMPKFKFKK